MEQQQGNILDPRPPAPVMNDGGPVCLWCEKIIYTEPASVHTDLGGTIEAQDLLVHEECAAEILTVYGEHATPRWGTIQ